MIKLATILESKDDYQKFILSDVERTLIYRVRVLLKDLPNDVFIKGTFINVPLYEFYGVVL